MSTMMITRTVRSLEAQQIIKDALAAYSVEMQIEAQGSEHFVTYSVTLEAGQVAYSTYRSSRGGKAHNGTPLPVTLPDDLLPAWNAFAAAIMTGCGVDQAYQRYLTERSGLAVGGGAAPDWDDLCTNKPDIAAAWADAANALTAGLGRFLDLGSRLGRDVCFRLVALIPRFVKHGGGSVRGQVDAHNCRAQRDDRGLF